MIKRITLPALLLVLGGAAQANAAITLVGHAVAQSSNGTSVTTTGVDTTGADLYLAFVASDNDNDYTVDGTTGCTWTGLTQYGFTNTNNTAQWFYCTPSSTGSGRVVTVSDANRPAVAFFAFSGSAASMPFDQEDGDDAGSVTSQQAGDGFTPSESNELIVVGVSSEFGGGTAMVDGGFTLIDDLGHDEPNATGIITGYLIQTSAAAVNPTVSWDGSANAAIALASFKAASGGGSSSRPLLLMGVGQ